MSTLQPNSTLQGGRYKILSTLGQGGFGITYLVIQSGLERKVAIKEFFMKDYCNRDEATSHVSIGSKGSVEMVTRYREKFVKEARNIARLNHPNIVKVIDVFEENGTAYYVMEYAACGSLSEKVKKEGYLSEPVATRYIRQIAEALDYIHQQKMNHLDVKPANIMLNEKDEPVLIDFGLAKQYDTETGNQTSSTPVGLSDGFAPLEQYRPGGVGEFSPESDVYALGATYYKLLTGVTPPNASDVNEDGLPLDELKAKGVSQTAINAIVAAMEPRKKHRTKSARVFISMLQSEDVTVAVAEDETVAMASYPRPKRVETFNSPKTAPVQPNQIVGKPEQPNNNSKIWLWIVIGFVAAFAIVFGASKLMRHSDTVGDKESESAVGYAEGYAEASGTDQQEISSQTFTANGVSFEMMLVKAGTFTMGTSEQGSDVDSDERPTHEVTLTNDFYIGKTEVTQVLWQAVMGSNPSYFLGYQLPVEQVSWDDCQMFLSRLNELTGKNFRLPTEAEWEFAARGGNNSQYFTYSGSNNIDEVAWYGDKSGSTHVVASKQPNELGIYDMSGNVYEWCSDCFGDYSSEPQTNPTGPSSGIGFICRGGSWSGDVNACRVSNRAYYSSYRNYKYQGLRLVLSE